MPNEESGQKKNRKFIIVSRDWSGLGFAKLGIKEGYEVIMAVKPDEDKIDDLKKEEFLIQGEGIVPKFHLDEVFKNRDKFKDWYWLFDGNHNYAEGDILHSEGFKVWGGTKFQHDMEEDREEAIKLAESVGLHSPPHHEFKSYQDGIKFLEQNEDKAFVFKPNGEDQAWTTVPIAPEPKNANIEIRQFLESVKMNDFILQEKVKGVEVNVEVFVQNGEPLFAQANLECKKRSNEDLGGATGCAMDVCWEVPMDCRLVKETVGLFFPYLKKIKYTGFWDSNVIFGEDGPYFLEYCHRWGFNAHPNLFSTISKKSMLTTCAELLDGEYVPEFRSGFGASVTIRIDKPKMGVPIYYPESMEDNFYLFDGYKEDDVLKTGGYDNDSCIVTAHNYTIEQAFEDAIMNAHKTKITNRDFRTDGAKTNYPSSPIRRYQALQSLKLI